MKFVFRVDASIELGTGHVMRCLTLADALKKRGDDCYFICRTLEGSSIELVRNRGYKTYSIDYHNIPEVSCSGEKQDLIDESRFNVYIDADLSKTKTIVKTIQPDWLIVDHYLLDSRWQSSLRDCVSNIMVIDDLANRVHDCDLLLNQNLGRTSQEYSHLVPCDTKLLIGPKYSLLRPEFAKLRAKSLIKRTTRRTRHLLISMGGMDSDNFTCKILSLLKSCSLPIDMRISVVIGPQAPWLRDVKVMVESMSRYTQLFVNVSNIEYLMMDCDFSIGAAGITAWERCCLGVPTLIFLMAENQRAGAIALQNFGAAIFLDDLNKLKEYIEEDKLFNNDRFLLRKLSTVAAGIVDGLGVNKVLEYLH